VRLAVAATAPLGADVLERLASKHEIAYLLTRPDRPRGRGRRVGSPPAKETAERLELEVHQPERLGADFDPGEDMVVVAAYGVLIPDAALDRALWLNVHPSLLPRWRGAAPVERAIMAGDEEEPCLEVCLLMKRAIPSAGLAILPCSGHGINLEEPALFNQLVDDFFHQVEAGRWRRRDPRAAPPSLHGPSGRP